MKKTIQIMVKDYIKLENNIMDYIKKLPKFSEKCTCKETTYFEVVEKCNEDDAVIGKYCLKCGGTCEN